MKPTRRNVTKQKSAAINARLGQLCTIAAHAREIGATAASASEITAQINEEFELDWVEHTYWVRARKAGYPWPGGTVRRLTPEESEKMYLRLRELCVAETPGTEIRKILNREFGLHWSFRVYYQRAKHLHLPWIATPKAGRHLCPVEYLPEPQRAACYEDPAYEARRKIADIVICRECFQILHDGGMDGKKGHLWTMEKMSEHQYHLKNPGAPIFTFERLAVQEGRDMDQLMENFAKKYATPEVLAAADRNPKYEVHNDPEHVICRVARCGRKSRGSLKKHLKSQHDITDVDVYRREHNWPPIIAPDAAKKKAKELSERNERLRELAEIGRQAGREAPETENPEKTARITFASCLSIERLSKGEMKFQLYPKQNIPKAAKSATKVFFSRNKEAIELEKTRLLALPESERRAEAERARIKLAS